MTKITELDRRKTVLLHQQADSQRFHGSFGISQCGFLKQRGQKKKFQTENFKYSRRAVCESDISRLLHNTACTPNPKLLNLVSFFNLKRKNA